MKLTSVKVLFIALLTSFMVGCNSNEKSVKSFEGDYTYSVDGSINAFLYTLGVEKDSVKTLPRKDRQMIALMGIYLEEIEADFSVSEDSLKGKATKGKGYQTFELKLDKVSGDSLLFADSKSFLVDMDSVFYFYVSSDNKKESRGLIMKKKEVK